MKLWMRLTLCAWLSACGSGPAPSGPPPGPTPGPVPQPTSVRLPSLSPVGVATPCVRPAYGRGFEYALLRVGCEDRLEPGRATWTVTGDTVVLEFLPESRGPRGVELVTTWPPLDQPPWLGHRVDRVAVLGDGGIRVEFGDPVRDPARLFVDPRLSGVPFPVAAGDVRDAIDADTEEIVTRHDASIEYARSLGRNVRMVAFDRLYLVAFAGSTGDDAARALRNALGVAWIDRGATLARQLPLLRWESVLEACGSHPASAAEEAGATSETAGPKAPSPPTVSYPEDDLAARQIAERMVSLGLPGGPLAMTVAELTGAGERMVVRPVAPGGDHWGPTDVAAVIAAAAGPVHPCSLYAEVGDKLGGWEAGPGRGTPAVLLIGETASFAIGPSSAPRR